MNNEKDIYDLAMALMNQHGLVALGWKFKFNHRNCAFGLCSLQKKIIFLSRQLSVIRPIDEVKNTILHEIAHAICPPIYSNGRWKKHHWVWKMKAIEIGCDGQTTNEMDPQIQEQVQTRKGKYSATCQCRTHIFYRRPKRMDGFRCRDCRQSLVFAPIVH